MVYCKMEVDLLTAIIINLSLLALLLIVYLFDINYFIRVAFVYCVANFKRKPLDFLDSSVIYGRVLPFDSDIQLVHMNNARVLRGFDFGRFDLWIRIGLLDTFLKDLIKLAVRPVFATANVIRYRRQLHMFAKYKIITKVVYWEGKTIYQEHKTVTTSDNITRNLGYSRVTFSFSIDNFVQKRYPHIRKPLPPKDLDLWMQYNEANGMNTRIRKKSIVENKGLLEENEGDCWSSGSN